MLAYTTISDKAEQEEKESATASFDRIEALVSTCFKSSNDNKQERKRKSPADKKPQKQEFMRQVSVAKAYKQQGSKARAVQRKDNEQDRLDRLARTNDDVDVDKQQEEFIGVKKTPTPVSLTTKCKYTRSSVSNAHCKVE